MRESLAPLNIAAIDRASARRVFIVVSAVP